jgi:mannitol-1-phosphate 5-dehydrogenase
VTQALGSDLAPLADVGIAEAMVLCTSLSPEADQDALLVRSQDAIRLPCDGEALIAGNPGLPGLEPLPGFEHQLQRKLATYNGINAVISYLGAERGYAYLAEAAKDPEIARWAAAAGDEASAALIAEFAFDPSEQRQWRDGALAKFADALIPDTISRNAGDPARKLGADDRLLYPALLAIRHGIMPKALAQGIAAALRYRENGQTLLERHGSVAAALAATAQVPSDHPLLELVVAHG